MTFQNGKNELLLDFLDKKLFNPILEALPEQYSSEREQVMLGDVKAKTLEEMELFHQKALTEEEIQTLFFHHLHKEISGTLGKEREDLELPRFLEIREQFICLYNELS